MFYCNSKCGLLTVIYLTIRPPSAFRESVGFHSEKLQRNSGFKRGGLYSWMV